MTKRDASGKALIRQACLPRRNCVGYSRFCHSPIGVAGFAELNPNLGELVRPRRFGQLLGTTHPTGRHLYVAALFEHCSPSQVTGTAVVARRPRNDTSTTHSVHDSAISNSLICSTIWTRTSNRCGFALRAIPRPGP
jgi:hypothetical protein